MISLTEPTIVCYRMEKISTVRFGRLRNGTAYMIIRAGEDKWWHECIEFIKWDDGEGEITDYCNIYKQIPTSVELINLIASATDWDKK